MTVSGVPVGDRIGLLLKHARVEVVDVQAMLNGRGDCVGIVGGDRSGREQRKNGSRECQRYYRAHLGALRRDGGRCRYDGRMAIIGKPLEIHGIDHVLLLVADLESAVAFYERVAGCSVETRLPRYAMIELRAGSSHIDLVDISVPEGAWARPKIEGGRNVDHVALGVASHDGSALRAHLEAHSVDISEERVEGASTSFYVRDPSGNTIELRSAPQTGRG